MKKLALSAILAATLVSAADFNYELTPVVGYLWNSTANEGGLQQDGAMGGVENHTVYGLELQSNTLDSEIKPELSVLYGRDTQFGEKFTGVLTTMLNGVYEIDTGTLITPFAKAGMGYEWYTNTHPTDFDGIVLDAGMGLKADLTKHIALKLEGLYLYKMNNNGAVDGSNGEVHNLAALAGLTFSFDEKETPVVAAVAAPVAAAVVAEEPKPTPAPKPTPVVAAPVAPTCPIDSDKDTIFDPQDKCPNTPAGFKVDAQGCPLTATLHINFKTDSAKIKLNGDREVDAFAEFLKENPVYNATIVGHTDSTASEAYNQKLSERRANAVKDVLVKDGVASDRLTTSGKGEASPIATNKTKEGRALNRRIEAELTTK
jgi:OOP family OmpA-OmpF porin